MEQTQPEAELHRKRQGELALLEILKKQRVLLDLWSDAFDEIEHGRSVEPKRLAKIVKLHEECRKLKIPGVP